MEPMGIVNYPAFLLAGILLNITPGADTFYIAARCLSGGRWAGVLSVLGISTGGVAHTLAAVCGLTLILSSSPKLFAAVQFSGVAYLFYLGGRTLVSSVPDGGRRLLLVPAISGARIYTEAVTTNVLNPKVALFFLAFLPQFIDREYTHPALSFLVLGATFIATGTLWGLVLVIAFCSLRSRLTRSIQSARLQALFQRISAAVFIALGVSLAFSAL